MRKNGDYIYEHSESAAISVAFSRAKEILKSGFEVELIFCEKVGNKDHVE